MVYKTEGKKEVKLSHLFLSLPLQLGAVVLLSGILLYTFLFSGYAPVHDMVHDLRHSLMFIPCH
jgi:cobalt transporter subunit CbtB